jgi:hypothetical protein
MHGKIKNGLAAKYPFLSEFLKSTANNGSKGEERRSTLGKLTQLHGAAPGPRQTAHKKGGKRNLGFDQGRRVGRMGGSKDVSQGHRAGPQGSTVNGRRTCPTSIVNLSYHPHTPSGMAKTPLEVISHGSLSDYEKAIRPYKRPLEPGRGRQHGAAPVAYSSTWSGSTAHEVEMNNSGMRSIRVFGREMLSEIAISDDFSIGQRLPNCVIPVNPDSFGGRLGLFADSYQEHKLLHMELHYEPTVPTTTTGALAMYFRNDTSIPTYIVGLEQFTHSSTHASFTQFSVWEEGHCHVEPSDALLRYFDTDSGSWRSSAQGEVVVMAASRLMAGSLGNLFVTYEYVFYSPELSYDVADPIAIQTALQFDTLSTTPASTPYSFVVATSITGTGPQIDIGATGIAPGNSPEYIFILTLDTLTSVTASFATEEMSANAAVAFDVGQAFYGRVIVAGGTPRMILYSNLSDAIEAPRYPTTSGLPADIAGLLVTTTSILPPQPGNIVSLGLRAWKLAD